MNNDNKNIIYTAADIEKYFSGQLSPAQMHEMEKAALDDPFLTEAMEGYEEMKGKDWKGTLAAVHKQVAESGSEARVVPMHKPARNWWRAAAAILVIGAGATLTFVLTRNRQEERSGHEEIAKLITVAPDTNKTIASPNSSAETATVKPSTYTIQQGKTSDKTSDKDSTGIAGSQDRSKANYLSTASGNNPVADSTKLNNGDLANTNNANPSPSSSANAAVTPASTVITNNAANGVISDNRFSEGKAREKNDNDGLSLKKQSAPVQKKKEQPMNNFFNAQVVATDNSPLPFTNISIKEEGFGTYADVKGNFRLVSADTVLNVEIRSVGYKPRTLQLKSNQPMNKIVLLEDETAVNDNEVIKSKDLGQAGRSRRATLLFDSVINAEPRDGWKNYSAYVANNIDIPEEKDDKQFHGEVELSFDVKANGTISNIRVDKSLGAAYDEAAKKLIEQGPQWKVKKGRRSKASVKVKF